MNSACYLQAEWVWRIIRLQELTLRATALIQLNNLTFGPKLGYRAMIAKTLGFESALRHLTVFVWHGRLTKFKGQVASLAPGLSAVTIAVVMFTGNMAHASNECGQVVNRQVQCGPDGDSNAPGVNPYANGISYIGHIGPNPTIQFLTLRGPGYKVEGSGVFLGVLHDDEAILNVIGDGEITTNSSAGVGIFARSFGDGAVTAHLELGAVTTGGERARGLVAEIRNADSRSTATARLTKGDINTGGGWGFGLWALTSGAGASLVQVDGGTVTTVGRSAHGLYARSDGGQAIVELGVDGDVIASGQLSYGIYAVGQTGFDVDVSGSVRGGGGAAIRTTSDAGGTIDISSTALVAAGTSGIALQDGGGDAVVTSAGDIAGDIRLDAGNDTLSLTGGRFTGGIYGGAGDDTVTIESTARYDGSHVLDGGAGDNDQLTLHGQTISNTAENFRNWERVTLNDTNLRLNELTRLDIDQLSINTGSAFRASGGGGGITIAGDVTNDGSVVLSVQDGATDDVITIEGDYTGSGSSVFALDAALAGNDANTDRLEIKGDASGEMMLSVTNLDSAGDEDTPLEIDVVSVGGTFNGTFALVDGNHVTPDGAQAVVSGAHLYTLTEAEDGRGWVLSALSETGGRNWQPSAPIYDSYGQSLLALNGPASLRSRGSSEDFRSLAWDGGPATQSAGSPLWFQMGTEQVTLAAEHSTTGAALDSSVWEMEIGGDIVLSESGAGLLVGGLMFSYATGSTAVTSAFGDGSIDTTGLGLGLAATWYDNRRFYVDGQFTFASYTSDLEADRIGTLADGNGGTGLALSIEAGQQLDLGARLTVIPQAQLSLSSVAFDDFEGERYGEQVTLEDASSQQLRLGLEFGAQEAQETRRLYGIVNLFHEFGAGSEVNVAGATLTTESEPWAVGVGFGGNYALTDRVDLFGEASYATGLSNAGDTSALSANAGLKMVF
ncbi:autotransporter outer membrane beta-barrel domain-containing protein [uncultured Ruegeria sp.]|uniref:autotransporter family protein n=1 Tax=uncultured Ruegeria sp. TaxID=259304 RepID=UPI00261F72BD|nr:autotransporter outer membrane beta-barrel domain-containing protein [uncultured Ruegeria sp.]